MDFLAASPARISAWAGDHVAGKAGAFAAGPATKMKVGDVIKRKGMRVKIVHIGRKKAYDGRVKAVTIYWRSC